MLSAQRKACKQIPLTNPPHKNQKYTPAEQTARPRLAAPRAQPPEQRRL